ncbi:glycosyltransferase [Vibrio coralliilyticus]|uniref:glycosyltransferase n=1 Tax=Vibrio coralliilyticus TaxID=190893 RepID=UPI00301E1CFB
MFIKRVTLRTQGGIEQVIKNLSKGLLELDQNVRILALSDEDKVVNYQGVEVVFFKRTFSIKSNCFSLSMLKNIKPHFDWADVINFHYPWPSGDMFIPLIDKVKPIVVTYHSDIVRQKLLRIVYSPLEKYFLKRADAIVPTSQNYLKSSTTLASYKEKCSVVALGVDFEEYTAVDTVIRESMEEKVGRDFFLFVGVLRYYKGLQYLVEAAKISNCPIVIAGKGPEEKRLKEYVKQNQLSNVHFLGFVSEAEKNALLSLCKCFVFPSFIRSEAFGVSLVEALYHGRPIISCDISTGTSFVNEHNLTGYVVAPADSQALATAMINMNEDKRYLEFVDNARTRAESLFSYQTMAESYLDIYNSLLSDES